MRILGFFAAFTLPLVVIASARFSWGWICTPLFVFTLIPLLDAVFGDNPTNPPESDYKRLKTSSIYAWLPRCYAMAQCLFLAWAATHVVQLSWSASLLFALSVGLVTGSVGINLAHELGHKTTRLDQWLSQFLLFQVNYMHFFIEHNKGHHAQVATPADPASSRLGESVYAFLPRTLLGSWRSAWQIECRRLERKGLTPWSTYNAMLWYALLPQFGALILGIVLGPKAVVFFYTQACVAVLLLEVINYVEHYGLSRRKLSSGRYEKVTEYHSWNATPLVSGYFLFHLQRHADHHAHPLRPYQTLRHMPQSPQLPAGYASMVPLALVPVLWRKVMDPRVLAVSSSP